MRMWQPWSPLAQAARNLFWVASGRGCRACRCGLRVVPARQGTGQPDRPLGCRLLAFLSRTGPRIGCPGSSTRPPWVIAIRPSRASACATSRTASMCARHASPSGQSRRATSEGQIEPGARSSQRVRIARAISAASESSRGDRGSAAVDFTAGSDPPALAPRGESHRAVAARSSDRGCGARRFRPSLQARRPPLAPSALRQ